MSYRKKSIQDRKLMQLKIKKYLAARDHPEWYRGLSSFQITAVESLLNNIRDDSQQGTTHRVQETLNKIGLNPPASSKHVKLIMHLSRGSDIAFLWFLMEMCYRHKCDDCKHEKQKIYTLNEEIIMTAIAHLEVIPTLRALDKLLPRQPPQSGAKAKPQLDKNNKKPKCKPCYPLPYFAKQPRPVPYGKKLSMHEPDTIPKLGRYEKYLNPNYTVPNESTKWYASYTLHEGKRVAKGVLQEEIANLFQKKTDIEHLVEGDDTPMFCKFHSTLQALKQNMINELVVARKKAAEKYFDMDGHVKDASKKRVIRMLDEELEKIAAVFDKYDNPEKMKEVQERCVNAPSVKQNADDDIDDTTYDYGHATPADDKRIYFKRPSTNTPYKFNYDKIFDGGCKDLIKETIANALEGCSSTGNFSIDFDKLVHHCCKDIWTEEVKASNKQFEEEQKKNRAPPKEPNFLGYELPYYDPYDRNLMNDMCYKAFQVLRKNRKFVLASMPDAHKLPVLKMFIKGRYGLVFTLQEKKADYMISKKMVYMVLKHEPVVRLPEIQDISEKRIVPYSCKDYILKKTNFVKQRYEHNFKMNLMQDIGNIWGTMRPFQCGRQKARDVFFSYFPSRENDVCLFRPWQTREYVNAKGEWDKRQRVKNASRLW